VSVLGLICGVLALAPAPAGGQTAEPDPRASARLHLGPVHLTPRFVIRRLGVDTNVFNEIENPRRDFTFTMGPELDVLVAPVSRFSLRATGLADFVYFQTYVSERAVNTEWRVRAEGRVRRIRVFAEDAFLDAKSRPNLEIDERVGRRENQFSLGVATQVAPRIEVGLQGRLSTIEYDEDATYSGVPLSRTLDAHWRALVASVRYRLTSYTTLTVNGEAAERTSPFAPERNADRVLVFPGVEFNPRALVSGWARVGYRNTRSLDDSVPDNSGVYADVGLAYTLLENTRLTFTMSRDLIYSAELEEPYYISTGYALTARRQLPRSFDVTVGASLTRFDYSDLVRPEALVLRVPPSRARVRGLSAGIGYTLRRATRVGLEAAYQERLYTRPDARAFHGLFVGTTLSHGF
jgi:hypothetical protein